MNIFKIERLTIPTDANDNRFRWLNLFSVFYENRGKNGNWVFASRNQNFEIDSPLRTNAVVIVPVVKTLDGERLLLIKEFRLPIRTYEYGFPAGLMDVDENAVDAAKRELEEETGLTVTNIIKSSPPVVSSAGLSDEIVEIVFVEAEGIISTDKQEASEDIESLLLDRAAVTRLCDRTGEFENVLISAKAWSILDSYKRFGSV